MKITAMFKMASIMVMLWCGFAMATGEPMVLKYKTLNTTAATSFGASYIIYLPLYGTVNATVDWGDGTTSTVTATGNLFHTYSLHNTYTVSISGTVTQFGNPDGLASNGQLQERQAKLIEVTSFGDIGLTSLSGAFNRAINLTTVPDTLPKGITDLNYTFAYAEKFNDDITNWDVSAVTDMRSMFIGAKAFNQNIGNWDVSKVTSMNYMFSDASSFNGDISSWNVSSVTDMSNMFVYTPFNQPIGNWNVSNVTSMSFMFYGAYSFNQDISKWNISNVKFMGYMFSNILPPGVGVQTAYYDSLLRSWSELPVQTGVSFSAGKSKYSLAAASARQKLIDTYSWTINDGGAATEQTITFGDLEMQYGDKATDAIATTSSSLTIKFTSSNEDVATIDNGIVTIVAAGTAEITASQIGDFTVAPATSVATLTVAKAPLTVTATAETVTLGKTPKLAYAITTGQLFGTDKFTGTLTADYSKVGSVDILQGTLSAGDNYDLSFVPAKLTVNAKTTGLLQTPSVPMIDLGRLHKFDLKGRTTKP